MPDQQDVIPLIGEPLRRRVDFRSPASASSISIRPLALASSRTAGETPCASRSPWRPEAHRRLPQRRSRLIVEIIDDVAVMDDFVFHVNGGAPEFEGSFYRIDRPLDAGAKASRLGCRLISSGTTIQNEKKKGKRYGLIFSSEVGMPTPPEREFWKNVNAGSF